MENNAPMDKDTGVREVNIEHLSMRQMLELDACTRCGECSNWCPAYEQDKRETINPRGRAHAFKQLIKRQYGLLRPDGFLGKLLGKKPITEAEIRQIATDLYACSTCRQCHFVCPVSIDTVELWESIRRCIVEAGYGPLDSQKDLVTSVKSYDNPWRQPRSSRARWTRIAKKKKRIHDEPKDMSKNKAEVLYFVGCTGSYDVNVEEVAINTVKIFEHSQTDYGILGNKERCCGSVLLRMGDHESFETIAKENIKQFNELGIKTLVTSCAGCFKTIKEDYAKIGGMNFDIKHTVEYLVDLIKSGKLELKHDVKMKVTYHDPCHLGRHSGVYDAPRQVLRMIPGIEFVEMERSREFSRCCGAGGGLKAGYPDMQNKIAQKRIDDALATGATELVSACPFCYQGLQVGIQATNAPLTMRDITELVAMSITGNVSSEIPEAEGGTDAE
jgi:heterodisulfide reductase subunit D